MDQCPIQDAGAATDQATFLDLAAMEHHLMPDGDPIVDDQGRPTRLKAAIVGNVQNAAILDIRLRPDANEMHIAPDYGHGPDRGVVPQLDLADYQRGGIDPGARCNLWVGTQIGT